MPTRELAIQVADDLQIAGRRIGAKVVVLYGGRAYEPQIEALATVDIVVGTPGRLLDLVRQGHLRLGQVRALVLDEADKMLDLGFLPDVEKILSLTPRDRQSMLFSATMPGEVVTLARRHLSQPMHIRAEQHDEPAHVPSTEQHVYRAHQLDKIEVLARRAAGRGPRPEHRVLPDQAVRRPGVQRADHRAASPPPPCTVTSARASGNGPCARSGPARWTSWSPPTWPPAGSTWTTSRT